MRMSISTLLWLMPMLPMQTTLTTITEQVAVLPPPACAAGVVPRNPETERAAVMHEPTKSRANLPVI